MNNKQFNEFSGQLIHSIQDLNFAEYLKLLPDYEQVDPLFEKAGLRNIYHERVSEITRQFALFKSEVKSHDVDLAKLEISDTQFFPRTEHGLEFYRLLILGETKDCRVELEIPVVLMLDGGELYPFSWILVTVSALAS